MADFLGTTQPTVTRLEKGQREPGPIARLLDQLETSIAADASQAAPLPAGDHQRSPAGDFASPEA